MISTLLYGRLGNLMFQIAAGYGLAKENNDEFVIDLKNGHLDKSVAHYEDNPVLAKFKRFDIRNYSIIKYFEPFFPYKKIPYTCYTNHVLVLCGYFQSELYFLDYKSEVCDLFLNSMIIDRITQKYRDILDNSVSISVRRTDYVKLSSYHNLLSIGYYIDGLKYIERIKKIDNILIMSDDIEWCKDNFCDNRITFIEGLKDYESLYLISLCKNNVDANSSFSWWGSYLNKNKDKIVIMPKIWLGKEANRDWQDIYPQNVVIL